MSAVCAGTDTVPETRVPSMVTYALLCETVDPALVGLTTTRPAVKVRAYTPPTFAYAATGVPMLTVLYGWAPQEAPAFLSRRKEKSEFPLLPSGACC